MTTYYARKEYIYDSGDTVFSIPFSYIKKEHIVVLINGENTNNYTYINTTQIRVTDTLQKGDKVTVARTTPINERMVVFSDTAILNKDVQNLAQIQTFNAVQEIYDNNEVFKIETNDTLASDKAEIEGIVETNRQELLAQVANDKTDTDKQIDDFKTEVNTTIEQVSEAATKINELEEAVNTAITAATTASEKADNATEEVANAKTEVNNAKEEVAKATEQAQIATAKAEEAKQTVESSLTEIENKTQTEINKIKQTGFYMQDGKLYYIDSEGNPQYYGLENYQVNNVYSLFDCKFADHKLNNSSWLRSEGQYNSGTVYISSYQELLEEYNNTESTEETENGVTFKRTPKGYKIALASQKTTIDNLYSSTGVAWYYVLDTANEQFMLPRTKYGFSGVRSKAGNYIAESLPNINGSLDVYPRFNTATGAFKLQTPITGLTNTNGLSYTASNSVAFNASLYSSTYQDDAPVQERSTEMHLYFYIGDTLQNTDLINIARLGEELVDIKADKLNKADVAAYVIETYVNGESGYNLYSNNYIEQWGRNHTENATITFLKPFKDTNYNVCTNVIGHIGNNYYGIDAGYFTTTTMYVNWDGGEENGSGFFWKVSGYLA